MKNSYFSVVPNRLSKTDPRYIRWRESLKKRPSTWSKGLTKETDSRVRKISETMRRKNIDNFAVWRLEMVKIGKIRSVYPPFEHSRELAYLIGMVLGDGNISRFPRSECLTIALNTKYTELNAYVRQLLRKFFEKTPTDNYQGNCLRLRIYQKNISSRLDVPAGARGKLQIGMPNWVWQNKEFLIWCLKGLFEAEGSLSIHLPTCTYNFQFSNRNPKLRSDVGRALETLGYHPEYHTVSTRLRRRDEVKSFQKLISFRENYPAGSSNGRTRPSGGRYHGPNPCPAAELHIKDEHLSK